MANETIGTVICPIAGDEAEVRQDKRQKLYYVGEAGMIKPNLPTGQAWLKKAAKFFVNVTNDEEQMSLVNETEIEQSEASQAAGFGSFFKWGDE